MKNPHFLYGIGIIAVIGVLSGFIGYTFPLPPPTQQAQAEENTAVAVTTPAKPTATTLVTTPKTDIIGPRFLTKTAGFAATYPA